MILVILISSILILLVGVGIWFTFGPGKKEYRDSIAEHAKMHELGIAHGHNSKGAFVTTKEKYTPRHKHQ